MTSHQIHKSTEQCSDETCAWGNGNRYKNVQEFQTKTEMQFEQGKKQFVEINKKIADLAETIGKLNLAYRFYRGRERRIHVNSGCRCWPYSRLKKGSRPSLHPLGFASDIRCLDRGSWGSSRRRRTYGRP